jgi:hypothetical protein
MQVRSDLRLWNIDDNDYVEARDLEANEIWEMPLRDVLKMPVVNEAVKTYVEIAKYECGTDVLKYISNKTLADIEEMMRTNMGGGLPIAGFYETKQEVYDLVQHNSV